MKVHFIYTETKTWDVPNAQLGIGLMSTILKKAGHETSLSHIWKKASKEKLILEIKKEKPQLIAITSNSLEFPLVKTLTDWIKKEVKVPIVLGGFHPTLDPEGVIAHKNIDMVCIGEGEYFILDLVEALEKGKKITDIPNLWVKKKGRLYKNPPRLLIADLDRLPFPDWSIFNYQWIVDKNYGVAKIMASRGCPFSCTFCCNDALKKIYRGKGNYVRRRGVENLLEEIKLLTEKYQITAIEFTDDLFTLDPKWLKEFCRKYSQHFKLKFTVEARVDTLNKELMAALKKAGCSMIRVGVETGNEWLRNKILKKQITNTQIQKTFKTAHQIGMKTVAYNIIGFPQETSNMIKETWNFNKEISPDILVINIFQPFLGTELRDFCIRQGYLSPDASLDFDFSDTQLKLPLLSRKELLSWYEKFDDWMLEGSLKTMHPSLTPFYRGLRVIFGKKTKDLFRKGRDLYANLGNWQI